LLKILVLSIIKELFTNQFYVTLPRT
jgi:hypothetical protein